jgi:TonB family protein
MSIGRTSMVRTLMGILLVSICVFALAQLNGRATPASNSSSAAANAAEILTDTMGVDFGPYMSQLLKGIRQNWYSIMPPSVYRPTSKQGKVSIEFNVLPDGKVKNMKIDDHSGDISMDRAAWGSITMSAPFPALPAGYHGPFLRLRLYYFYNLEPDTISVRILPGNEVQVPAGSTFQFSTTGKGLPDTSVKWSVTGPGCSKADCGIISDTGLYIAPENIPSPPTIVVQAASPTDSSRIAKSRLTVVPAGPPH